LQDILNFAQGTLFRLTFFIMILGLIRIVILDIWGAVESYRKAGDKKLEWGAAVISTLNWLFPVRRLFTQRPLYSLFSILFHVGLILVPIFLLAHIQLWRASLGFGWPALPEFWADLLTLTTIFFGVALFLGRLASQRSRALSRFQDYFWPILLIIPFFTGYACANLGLTPAAYQWFMLIHVLSGELIFVLLPFTKIAHCVLVPMSQFIIRLSWKFPARINDKIEATLDKKGAPV